MQILALKKLYLQSVFENGLSQSSFEKLNKEHQKMLVKKLEKYHLKPEYRKTIIVAMTGGVFDIIHPGHILTLEEAKKHGDILVVAIATDETVRKIKKREPMHSLDERVKMVNALKPVDLAIAGGENWQDTLNRVSPDIVIFGYDQKEKEIPSTKTIKLDIFSSHENSKTGKVREKLGI
ncbi:MAG: adenylyltransferase/cytidyltransferase family protein [Candidatus Micrarchaeia archaeon]